MLKLFLCSIILIEECWCWLCRELRDFFIKLAAWKYGWYKDTFTPSLLVTLTIVDILLSFIGLSSGGSNTPETPINIQDIPYETDYRLEISMYPHRFLGLEDLLLEDVGDV